MSVAILRMPHGLDYSLILSSKMNGNGAGHVNQAFNGLNDVLTDEDWQTAVKGKLFKINFKFYLNLNIFFSAIKRKEI